MRTSLLYSELPAPPTPGPEARLTPFTTPDDFPAPCPGWENDAYASSGIEGPSPCASFLAHVPADVSLTGVPGMLPEEKLTLARWIDLGAPINLGTPWDSWKTTCARPWSCAPPGPSHLHSERARWGWACYAGGAQLQCGGGSGWRWSSVAHKMEPEIVATLELWDNPG